MAALCRLWQWLVRLADAHGVATLALQILPQAISSGLVVMLGILQDIPWMWVALAGLWAFAGISFGLVWYDKWRFRTDPRNKLLIVAPSVFANVTKRGEELLYIQVVLNLKNIAPFTMYYRVRHISSTFEGRTNRLASSPHRAVFHEIEPKQTGRYRDSAVNVDGILFGNHTLMIDYDLDYGRRKANLHKINGTVRVDITASESGFSTVWSNARDEKDTH